MFKRAQRVSAGCRFGHVGWKHWHRPPRQRGCRLVYENVGLLAVKAGDKEGLFEFTEARNRTRGF